MPIMLTSPAVEDGGFLPKTYASDGDNISPPLHWEGVPEAARSLVLLLDDADATDGPRVHWILFNLPADCRELAEHFPSKPTVPDGPKEGLSIRQGKNDFDKLGYHGPVPDRSKPHHYGFTMYALDCTLHLPVGCSKSELLGSIRTHVLDEGRLLVQYSE